MSTINQLIDSIVDENSVESEQIFSSLMADKIADRLQDYRKEVAAKFFPVEAEASDEVSEE